MTAWRELAADVTYFYKWGPHDAWGLSHSKLEFWAEQALRIKHA
ncbi:MAG: hypothetical protein MESAZ_02733 [Saezia sanguinis]|mgnify:CR=1 FL=1